MKTYIILFISLILIQELSAQELTKKEKKSIKKEIRSLLKNPEKYVALKQESEDKTSVINQQYDDLMALEKKSLLRHLSLIERNDSLINEIKTLSKAKDLHPNIAQSKYSVQIGAYKNYDISALLDNPVSISYGYINGLYKYYIGNFQTIEDASFFAEQFRKLGIEGAFVTEDLRKLNQKLTVKKEIVSETVKEKTQNIPTSHSTIHNFESSKTLKKETSKEPNVIYMD